MNNLVILLQKYKKKIILPNFYAKKAKKLS